MPFTNRLISQTSAYLLQHAHNPVDWYPWGNEAFNAAKRLNRPIFLSIGYSACHWCHVMEEESFTNAETARLLNDNFISIKVDREERPDIDHIYMAAIQLLNQRGGWPLSAFLSHDLKPFYGGTYFPPDDRHGMPSFSRILSGIIAAWKTRRDELLNTANQVTEGLNSFFTVSEAQTTVPKFASLLSQFITVAANHFDSVEGGFGSAPKFFHTEQLRLFLRDYRYTRSIESLQTVNLTLEKMACGGICDQLAGGFHRYSTDRVWLAPHFEKMLYDNALLTQCLIEAFAETKSPFFAKVAFDTLNFVLREMTDPNGGFYSTLDADSEGEEGRFYVWSKEEITQALPPDEVDLVCRYFDVSSQGNWEGKTILRLPATPTEFCKAHSTDEGWLEDKISNARRLLLNEREKRVRPFRDEKLIVAWNGMMIDTLAQASITLGDPQYLSSAENAAQFLWTQLYINGKLGHSMAQGKTVSPGFLDDYAFFINALVSLFNASQKPQWLLRALEVARLMTSTFWDSDKGSFFYSPQDPQYIIRTRDYQDGATPSASAMATLALARLALITSDSKTLDIAFRALEAMGPVIEKYPLACGTWILAADYLIHEPKLIVFCASETEDDSAGIMHRLWAHAAPNQAVVKITPELIRAFPQFKDKQTVKGENTIYVCTNSACEAPIVGAEAISKWLDSIELAIPVRAVR